MSVEDVWAGWWQLLIKEDHEAQAVEMFFGLTESAQAELLGWLAARSRRTREKIKDIGQELIQLQAEIIQQQDIIDDFTRQIRQLKGLPPLDRAAW
jgi:hypothetical protein